MFLTGVDLDHANQAEENDFTRGFEMSDDEIVVPVISGTVVKVASETERGSWPESPESDSEHPVSF